ncbi:hypothetical protein [Sphaerochaeta globosa]|uniref:Nucleic acid-binding protein contains PIN domain-like protein n=1 Tax=Sphaerochaeta globosa (strain ATCC BAA-1886 / DSM 22777 / Buddy) TaxID=158189 RepID=F0RRN7_SPHGB|nr:hypothetical protein [Sphaerochaeta globosa]ADY14296.1 hypothetical protein SpiBuddy_2483 [Sphaerochaeta globosa str. Buddy]
MLIDPIYFDTDCLSAFLWVKHENVLQSLYPGRLFIPYETYSEISKVPHLKAQTDSMIANQQLQIEHILIDSKAYEIFSTLTSPKAGRMAIGNGEAACIALAIINDGLLASNNLRDVAHYVKIYNLQHITSPSILEAALNQKLVTEAQGNTIWASMLAKRRKLPNATFSDYLYLHQ